MKRVLKALGVMALVAMLLPAAVAPASAAAPAPAKWTIMVYISGDNSLDASVVPDIETELGALGSNADVQVVALADRAAGAAWSQTLLFHVTAGMAATPENAVADWGERDMGDPQTLLDFVAWSKANYPATHYWLSFWGHGWSWRPEYTMRDDTNSDILDPDEIEPIRAQLGFIDVISYDACQMATIEVANIWHDYATAVSFSQEYVGWDGIEYDRVIAQLHANPLMAVDNVAIQVTQSAAGNKERTWSTIAVDGRFDALLAAVDQFGIALQAGNATYHTSYNNAFRATRSFNADPQSLDLAGFATNIKAKVNDANIKNKATAVINAYNVVKLAEWHTKAYAGASGLSIFLTNSAAGLDSPATTVDDYQYYLTLGFATWHWDEFVYAFATY